ncbi:hypothetical protein [Halobellus captivus]|uniref:hypothetical protein n=1 Tax=Halobellus captivus TaxID=2592614 RepID=UPI0011A94E47|nr:hypothetical protein [Halobellus captivus]
MAVTENPSELSSTFRWAASTVANFVVGTIILGILFVAVSAPVLFVLPTIYPQAVPFAWLAVAGLVLGMLSLDLTDEEADILQGIVQRMSDMTRRERYVFLISLYTILIGGVSVEVALISIVTSLLASQASLPLVAVVLAIGYPSIDASIGDKIGINVATVGAILATLVMQAFAAVYRVSPAVPKAASLEIRSGLTH